MLHLILNLCYVSWERKHDKTKNENYFFILFEIPLTKTKTSHNPLLISITSTIYLRRSIYFPKYNKSLVHSIRKLTKGKDTSPNDLYKMVRMKCFVDPEEGFTLLTRRVFEVIRLEMHFWVRRLSFMWIYISFRFHCVRHIIFIEWMKYIIYILSIMFGWLLKSCIVWRISRS